MTRGSYACRDYRKNRTKAANSDWTVIKQGFANSVTNNVLKDMDCLEKDYGGNVTQQEDEHKF